MLLGKRARVVESRLILVDKQRFDLDALVPQLGHYLGQALRRARRKRQNAYRPAGLRERPVRFRKLAFDDLEAIADRLGIPDIEPKAVDVPGKGAGAFPLAVKVVAGIERLPLRRPVFHAAAIRAYAVDQPEVGPGLLIDELVQRAFAVHIRADGAEKRDEQAVQRALCVHIRANEVEHRNKQAVYRHPVLELELFFFLRSGSGLHDPQV